MSDPESVYRQEKRQRTDREARVFGELVIEVSRAEKPSVYEVGETKGENVRKVELGDPAPKTECRNSCYNRSCLNQLEGSFSFFSLFSLFPSRVVSSSRISTRKHPPGAKNKGKGVYARKDSYRV